MPVKVLHLRSSAGFFGAERVIITLMKRSPDDHIEATLACIENYISGDQSLLYHAKEVGLKALEIPCKSRFDLKTIRKILEYCQQNQIDVIHSHDYKSLFYGIIASKLYGSKLIATLHGKTSGNIKNRAYEYIENLMLQLASHITVVSDQLLESLSKTGLKKKVTQIANGVDDESFNPDVKGFGKQYWGFNSENFVFGTIARMSEEKGHSLLIEAFSKIHKSYPDARLLLVGDGPLYEELKSLVNERGLKDKINFTGSRTEIEQILTDLDCYVSPSHTEGMPMSILEAMATGLPIVATEVGSVGYLLRDDYGKLVSPGDVRALAEQMQAVLDSKDKIKISGSRCRKRAVNEFSAKIQSRKFAELYHSSLGMI